MADEKVVESVELEITNLKYKYDDLEVTLRENSGDSVHNVVVALKRAGKSEEINGSNINSFLSRARKEIVAEAKAIVDAEIAEAKAVAEAEMEIAESLVEPVEEDEEVLDEEELI